MLRMEKWNVFTIAKSPRHCKDLPNRNHNQGLWEVRGNIKPRFSVGFWDFTLAQSLTDHIGGRSCSVRPYLVSTIWCRTSINCNHDTLATSLERRIFTNTYSQNALPHQLCSKSYRLFLLGICNISNPITKLTESLWVPSCCFTCYISSQ